MQLGGNIPILGSIPAAMLLNPIVCALITVALFGAEPSAEVILTRRHLYKRRLAESGRSSGPTAKRFSASRYPPFSCCRGLFHQWQAVRRQCVACWPVVGVRPDGQNDQCHRVACFHQFVIYRYRWVQRNHEARSLWKTLGALFAVPALGVALLVTFNQYRFGNGFRSGYAGGEAFTNPLFLGLRNLFFNRSESILVFSPLFILAVVGMPLSWRRSRSQTLLLAGFTIVQLILFAPWYDWRGGLAWGPRCLLPLTPFFVLLMLPLMHDWLFVRRGWRRMILIRFATLSVGVQIVGVLTPYREVDTPWPILSALSLVSSITLVGAGGRLVTDARTDRLACGSAFRGAPFARRGSGRCYLAHPFTATPCADMDGRGSALGVSGRRDLGCCASLSGSAHASR